MSSPLKCVVAAAMLGLIAALAAPAAQSEEQATYRFDLPAQPLMDSLRAVAQQTGSNVLFQSKDVHGIKVPELKGELTVSEAIERLLAGTRLSAERTTPTTVIVQPLPAPSPTAMRSAEDPQTRLAQTHTATLATTPAQESARGAQEESAGKSDSKIQEIVVTAQKREERLKDVPISISVLKGGDLDRANVSGATDALNFVPGVVAFASVQGGGTQISVRGVAPSGAIFSGSNPIGYYLDSAPFGLVESAIAPDPDAYDLQRIEVLRGPQGTLYGAGGENGVVRILTNDANLHEVDFKARSTVSSTEGGAGNYRGDVAVNVPLIEGKLAVRAVVGYGSESGWIDSPIERRMNDAELRTYRLKINAQPTENLSIGLSGWSSRNDFGAPSESDDADRYGAAFAQPMSTDYDVLGAKIAYEFAHFSLSSVTSNLSYGNAFVHDITPTNLGLSTIFTSQDSDVFSQEVLFNSKEGSVWRWSGGLFYRNGKDVVFQQITGLVDYTDTSNRSESSAIFGEIGRRFAHDRLEWTLGLRRFHDKVLSKENSIAAALNRPLYRATDSFDSTTPRAVLTWYPNREVTVYGSYSEGFRSGFPQGRDIAVAFPEFPPLQPDKLRNYEVGAKAELWDGKLSLDTAVYYIRWEGVQQTLSVAYQGSFPTARVNGESASGLGIDFSASTRPVDGLTLGLNFSWNDLALDSDVYSAGFVLFSAGDRLNYSPAYTGGASADYSFPLGSSGFEGRFAASARYSSKQENHGIFVTPFINSEDALLFTRASFSVRSPSNWLVTLFVENAGNERGAYPALVPFEQLTPRVRPRTAGLQLNYSLR